MRASPDAARWSGDLKSHCLAALFLREVPTFALADGTIHRCEAGDEPVRAHDALLAAAAVSVDGSLLTAGEDGRLCRTAGTGEPTEIAVIPRKWITSVAADPQGQFAYACGRSVWLHCGTDPVRELQHKRAVKALAMSADGARLAVAQQDSIVIHSMSDDDAPIELAATGIPAALTFSPDAKYLLVAGKDSSLHGWRLADGQHLRMLGYQDKVGDWSWSASGMWLVTAGASSAIAWPFDGPNGPIGKTALELGTREGGVATAVACHPFGESVAIGYSDGVIQVAAFDESPDIALLDRCRGAVTSLSWHPGGQVLAYGSASGECGVLDIVNEAVVEEAK